MSTIAARLKNLFLSSWHPFAWFALIGLLVYGQTLFFGFSYLDDNVLIVDHIKDLTNFANIGRFFQEDVFHLMGWSAAYYRPLLTLSFMANAIFAGLHPFLYHLTNVLIHIVVTCFIFQLLLKLGFRRVKVFCLSFLFLIHPVVVQAVAWLPGRNDSLLAFFAVPSFIFFLNYLEKHKRGDYAWHLVFFLCALLTKETAIALPVVCFFFNFLIKEPKPARLPLKFYAGWLGCFLIWLS
jgi:hypothetical protein